MNGYIKLHRRLLEDPLWTQVPTAWGRVALAMLMTANWKPRKWFDGRREILLPPGALVTSRPSMCKLARVTPKEYRGAIQYLANTGFLGQQTASRYTVFTIENWDTYQGNGDPGGQQTASVGPSEGQLRATPEERKKSSSKKDKKKEPVFVGEEVDAQPQGENPKGLSKIHDDDKPKPLWASARDELIATILESTGERPDRKLLRQIDDAVQSRGGTIRQYLDDIRPRIGRLKKRPGFGFFHEHARNWGGSEQRQAPEPQQQAPKCSCRFGQIEVDGEWRPCPECRLGQDLAKMNALLAKEREAARTQKVAEEPAA